MIQECQAASYKLIESCLRAQKHISASDGAAFMLKKETALSRLKQARRASMSNERRKDDEVDKMLQSLRVSSAFFGHPVHGPEDLEKLDNSPYEQELGFMAELIAYHGITSSACCDTVIRESRELIGKVGQGVHSALCKLFADNMADHASQYLTWSADVEEEGETLRGTQQRLAQGAKLISDHVKARRLL